MSNDPKEATMESLIQAKREILPSFDLVAKKADDIYFKESIISKKELETIEYKRVYKKLRNGESIEDELEYEWLTIDLMKKLIED
jgi:hypothetical protein